MIDVGDVAARFTGRRVAVAAVLASADERSQMLDLEPAALKYCALTVMEIIDSMLTGKQNKLARMKFTRALSSYEQQLNKL